MEWKEAVYVLRTPILHGGGRHYIHAMSHFDGDSFPWYLYAHSYQSAADFLVSNLGDVERECPLRHPVSLPALLSSSRSTCSSWTSTSIATARGI